MFAVGYFVRQADGYERDEWTVEFVTDDIDEAMDNIFYCRDRAAEGCSLWEGAAAMIQVIRDGIISWEPLDEEQYAE